jgi:predicted nucleic acid-binding protein
MALLISDANIIIDMESAGILDKMFRLPERFAVPNVLYDEELKTHHAHLPGLGLEVLEIQEEYVLEAFQLGEIYRRASHNDLLALSLAKQERCPLLTGDRGLREAAEKERVEVRGTLWIMDRLFAEGILDYAKVHNAYEKMKQDNRRLPWDEVEAQLEKMRRT